MQAILPMCSGPPPWHQCNVCAAALCGVCRFGATNSEGEVEYHQVEQPQMIEACGDTARYLKPYQMVGAAGL